MTPKKKLIEVALPLEAINYRLYTICERKKRASEAMAYNGMEQSWREIVRLAREAPRAVTPGTDDLFAEERPCTLA